MNRFMATARGRDGHRRGGGAAVQGALNGAVVGRWREREEAVAANSVEAWVRNASADAIDGMDVTMPTLIKFGVDPEQKVRVAKLYAFFKLMEFVRFQQWRGFPPV